MAEQEKIDFPTEVSAEEVAPAAKAPAPRRRTRKPKAADAEAATGAAEQAAAPVASAAPEASAPVPADEKVEEKPRARRGRPRKAAAKVSADAPAEAEQTVSDEVAAARALSKVSQAEVARRQRAEEDRAAALIASGAAGDAQAAAAALIDPALRPHRRGRKPKAYVEAEKAAAAALAAQQAAYLARQDAAKEGDGDPAAAPKAEGEMPDVRPGRGRRSRAAAKEAAPEKPMAAEAAPAAAEAAEAVPARAAESEDAAAAGNHRSRRHQRAQEERGNDQRNNDQGRNDQRGDRFDRNGNGRNNRQGNNRKNRNNRFNGPTEPSVSREELAALKVAELRERAKEFGIEYVGKKKAELVEEVYTAAARAEGFRDIEGILDITNDGFGYIRAHGYMPSRDDAFVAANLIRAAGLRPGDMVAGTLRPMRANDKFPGLAKIRTVNGVDPEEMRRRPKFSDLTPIYPNQPLRMEHGRESITGRAIDIVAPIGKGQRGLIVSPPKAGKTTVLKHICQSIAANNPEVHLICLLVDERPEEVTDMQRSIRGDVVASTFDMPADNHTRVSELVIERAKRLVEMGGDVVVVLDSITRLARAYNLAAPASGRILSGGVDSAALYPPKKFLGAARNIENGGSLTILASALVETGSKMDEVIFEEFKGTGNMELKLDRDLADRRIFPAIDPIASGTRNEDLLIDDSLRPFVWGIRRILAGMNNTERAAASFIKGLKATDSNQEFLIRTAKKAQDHPEAL